jgi:hypothetical protein
MFGCKKIIFFGGEILQCLAPKIIASCTKDLFYKKIFESQHILKEKKVQFAIFRPWVLVIYNEVSKNKFHLG